MPLSSNILVPGGRVPTAHDFGGPDCSYPKPPASQEFCDRLATAAKERGRPLTSTEVSLVAEGKPLPPVLKKEREKTLAELEMQVAALTARLDALERAQKNSTLPHLKERELC